jgi:predicted ATP-dependent serine protease
VSLPEGYSSSFEPEEPPQEEPRWRLRPLSQATPRQTRWLVPGKILLGYNNLIAAVGGVGKTHLLLAIAAEGSVADEPWDTIYVSFEDSAEEVLRPRVEAAGGDVARVHELVLTDADSLASFTLPRDIEELQTLVRACTARLVVIDPIVASIETKLDAYKDQHVRQVLAQLWTMAREEECAVAPWSAT